MSDIVKPIVVDTDSPPSNREAELDTKLNFGNGSNGSVQERRARARNKLTGISEEVAGAEEIVELDDNDCGVINSFRDESGRSRPLPVRKTRSGASSNASTKPSLLDNPKISTIRQHYYPEGGWGWVICVCGFIIHMLSSGLLLSYGILYREILDEFGEEYSVEAMWLGSMSMSTGLFVAPLIVAFCRRKSTRLTAVFGGLTSSLGCLFTSFASQLHQVYFSYGFLMALGLGLARETSSLMIGQYFKRKRETVEAIVQSGTGIGVVVFSYVFSHIIRALGWRLGLHAITGIAVLPFFVGIFYRSASLYHPQRRAILHLKNQRKKIKDKSGISDKPPFFDFVPLKSGSLIVTMISSGICSFGLYAPFFHFIPLLQVEGIEEDSILLLQLFVGIAYSMGCLLFGIMVVRRSVECMIAKHYLCQAAMVGSGLSHLCLCALRGYNGYVLFAWLYGIFCGGQGYTLKMLVFESGRAKGFGRAWAYVQWAQSFPVLFGIPITGYISKNHGERAGFYFSAACCFAGALSMTCINMYRYSYTVSKRGQGSCSTCTSQASTELRTQESLDTGVCTCTSNSIHSNNPSHAKCQKTISFASTVNIAEDDPKNPDFITTEEPLVGCKVRDNWCPSEPSQAPTRNFGQHFVYEEYANAVLEDGNGLLPMDLNIDECQCWREEDNNKPTVASPSRIPITVIGEVTSAV